MWDKERRKEMVKAGGKKRFIVNTVWLLYTQSYNTCIVVEILSHRFTPPSLENIMTLIKML